MISFDSLKDSYLRHKSESSKLSWHAPMERSFIPTFPLEKPTEIQVVRNVPSVLTRRNSSSTPAIDIDIPQDRLNDCLPIVHGRSASMDVTLLSSVQQSQEQQEIQVNHSDVPSDSDCSSNHSSRTLKPADNTVTAEHNYEMFTRGNKDSPHTSSIYVKSGKHSVRKRPSPHRSGPKRTPLKRYSSVAPTVIIPTTTANGGCQSAPMRVPTEELLNDFGPEIFSVPPVIEDTDGMQKAEDNEESPDEYRTPPNTRPVSEEIEPRPCSEVFQPYIFDEIRRGSESKLTLEEDINRLQIFDSTQLPPDEPTLKCNEEEFSSPPENFTGNFTVESDSTNEQRTETLGELIFTTDDYHHPSLTEQRSYSPFGKTIVPSPIFCSTVSCDYDSSPMADGYVSSPVSQRNSDDDYHIPLVESDRNLTSTPPPPPPPSVPPPLPQTSEGFGTAQQRRIDRRYHTADAIEPLKSVRGDPICKRHSWNISSACRTTTTFPTQTHFNCLSSESFCSSSGVSSSDSQLCVFSTQSIGIDSIQNGYVSSVSISDDFDSSPPGDTTPQQSRKDINHNRMDDGNKLIVNEEFLTRDELIHFLSKGQVESS